MTRSTKRALVKNACGITILVGLVLLTGEPVPEMGTGEYLLRTAADFAVIILAARPFNRICEIEERAERIRKINTSKAATK